MRRFSKETHRLACVAVFLAGCSAAPAGEADAPSNAVDEALSTHGPASEAAAGGLDAGASGCGLRFVAIGGDAAPGNTCRSRATPCGSMGQAVAVAQRRRRRLRRCRHVRRERGRRQGADDLRPRRAHDRRPRGLGPPSLRRQLSLRRRREQRLPRSRQRRDAGGLHGRRRQSRARERRRGRRRRRRRAQRDHHRRFGHVRSPRRRRRDRSQRVPARARRHERRHVPLRGQPCDQRVERSAGDRHLQHGRRRRHRRQRRFERRSGHRLELLSRGDVRAQPGLRHGRRHPHRQPGLPLRDRPPTRSSTTSSPGAPPRVSAPSCSCLAARHLPRQPCHRLHRGARGLRRASPGAEVALWAIASTTGSGRQGP